MSDPKVDIKKYSLEELRAEITLRTLGRKVGYKIDLGDDYGRSYIFEKSKKKLKEHIIRSYGRYEIWMDDQIIPVYSRQPEAKYLR